MANPVVHWEIGGRDLEKLGWFYGELFGWDPRPAGPEYQLVEVGPPGIGGGLIEMEPHVTIYVSVQDADATLQRVRELGGTVLHTPERIPGFGRFAVFGDIEGNVVGLFEEAEALEPAE
jgi:predicted enzyme related to lactoylglutathione lyase